MCLSLHNTDRGLSFYNNYAINNLKIRFLRILLVSYGSMEKLNFKENIHIYINDRNAIGLPFTKLKALNNINNKVVKNTVKPLW